MRGRVVEVVLGVVLLAGCSGGTPTPVARPASSVPGDSGSPTGGTGGTGGTVVSPSTSPSNRATKGSVRVPPRAEKADPRWRFYGHDRGRFTSAWFAGAHRVMIGYGCTVAPYYAHDPRCPGREGFHHGIDVAMPCGTRLFAGRGGTVVDPASPGAPGAAYGPFAFRIRSGGVDVLVGHVRVVYVGPGEAVHRGQVIARANDQGAPDGCHLHFEVRRAGGGLADALDPSRLLHLSRAPPG